MWTEYTIDARLDEATSSISARETVIIHNNSPDRLDAIQMRLDQNVFRLDAERDWVIDESTGGAEVTRLVVNGMPVDLSPASLSRSRLDLTRTSVRLDLVRPVGPRSTGKLEVDWRFRIPRDEHNLRLRMGRWGDSVLQIAQWYPRIAAYDDLRGWDTLPYRGPLEFYNNYGRFDVTIDVPSGWLVGATGALQNENDVLTSAARDRLSNAERTDSVVAIIGFEGPPHRPAAASTRTRWHFVADTASDFAWATSDRYGWSATGGRVAGRGHVRLQSLHLRQETARAQAVLTDNRRAMETYSQSLTPYPFAGLTFASGPERGMEYPMLVMGLGGAHEVAHMWFPMLVGTNETWYAFMDEGFANYLGHLTQGKNSERFSALDGIGALYGGTAGSPTDLPLISDEAVRYPPYSIQGYSKVPQMLSMLGEIAGDSSVLAAVGEYVRSWRFKHPSPWDFMFAMNAALRRDLNWFWYYWLFTTASVNASIDRVVRSANGHVITVRQDGEMPSPVILRVRMASEGPRIRPPREAKVIDSVTYELAYPVDVWFGGRRTFDVTIDFGGREIEQITLDPRRRIPDSRQADNVWSRR
jgi:hypothetical protein